MPSSPPQPVPDFSSGASPGTPPNPVGDFSGVTPSAPPDVLSEPGVGVAATLQQDDGGSPTVTVHVLYTATTPGAAGNELSLIFEEPTTVGSGDGSIDSLTVSPNSVTVAWTISEGIGATNPTLQGLKAAINANGSAAALFTGVDGSSDDDLQAWVIAGYGVTPTYPISASFSGGSGLTTVPDSPPAPVADFSTVTPSSPPQPLS